MLDVDLLITNNIDNKGMFVCLRSKTTSFITPALVENIRYLQNSLAEKYLSKVYDLNYYVIWYLENTTKNRYHGLDFAFIVNCIKHHEDAKFEHYINRLFNLIFLNYIGLGLPIVNCSIVTHELKGISKDFFLINKICFLQDSKVNGINKIEPSKAFPKLVFDRTIYLKNHYFNYHSMEVDKIRSIIESINYDVPNEEEVNQIKLHFEKLKEETISGIYALASKNIKILERMGREV